MSGSSEYDEIRHAYDDAFHRWSHGERSPVAERDYHRLRDQLARYILEHVKPDEARAGSDLRRPAASAGDRA